MRRRDMDRIRFRRLGEAGEASALRQGTASGPGVRKNLGIALVSNIDGSALVGGRVKTRMDRHSQLNHGREEPKMPR